MKNVKKYNKAVRQIRAVNLVQAICLAVAVYRLFQGEFIAAGIFVVVARLFELGLPVTRQTEEDD